MPVRSPKSAPVLRSRLTRLLLRSLVAVLSLAATHPASAQMAPPPASGTQEYTILIFESDAQLALRTSPAAADAYWTAYDVFAASLAKAGVLRGGSALDERLRATVRGTGSADAAVRGARLSGYFVIAVKDLRAAEEWARQAPARATAVEVRPHRTNPHMAAPAAGR